MQIISVDQAQIATWYRSVVRHNTFHLHRIYVQCSANTVGQGVVTSALSFTTFRLRKCVIL